MKKSKPHLFETVFHRLLPFDHMTLIYCWTIVILIVGFARPIGDFVTVLLFHLGVIALVILLVKYAHLRTGRPIVFIRLLYPVILMALFYSTSGKLVHLFFPEFLDYQVVALEKQIFGVSPTIWLDGNLNVYVTEILSASYFSYYFMIPGLSLLLFFSRRDRETKRFVTASCVTFFISYLIFIAYPIEGPRHYLAADYQNVITGPIFRPLVDMIINNAAFHGGAMPSSHIAEALVVMFFAIRNYGRKAWFLILIVSGLALGTVWGRFHYIADVIVGIAIGCLATWLTLIFYAVEKESARERRRANTTIKDIYASNDI